ncbi:MAG TPA: hypothetical protein VFJ51_11005 [Nitrososphaeraceae archaeon]|nr:hypothetical protein [Nitrososphaeraceae archaeon]
MVASADTAIMIESTIMNDFLPCAMDNLWATDDNELAQIERDLTKET